MNQVGYVVFKITRNLTSYISDSVSLQKNMKKLQWGEKEMHTKFC